MTDEDDDIIGYGIVKDGDGSQFSINEQTGALRFNTPPNFEAPADVEFTDPNNSDNNNAEKNNEYIVFVEATSGEGTRVLTSRAALIVTVSDENEKPVFSSAMTFEVAENEQSVGTVVAEDVDSEDSITGYAITGGDDQGQFLIDSATGALTFKTAPNYEASADADNNNTYIVAVTATGGAGVRSLTEAQTITVTVTDENEAPGKPAAPEMTAATLNSLTITWREPENTGPEITDYDVQYKVVGRDFIPWPHNGTGLTTMITNLEDGEDYLVQVRATNAEGTGKWSNSGYGITSDDFPPRFTSSSTFNVEENTIQVGTVVAEDYDGDSITGYAITGGVSQARFSIDSATGVLSLNTAPNFEARRGVPYIVIVSATSGEADRERTGHQRIYVTVTDVEEAPAAPMTPTVVQATMNSLMVTWREPENTGPEITDYDVQYRINSSGGNFIDAGHDGTDLTVTLTQLQANTTYEFQVRAHNAEGTSDWSASGVGITSKNVAPTFTSNAMFNVVENNTMVGTVDADDGDSEDSIEGYAITGGADQDKFSIVSGTGVLSFQTAPDFERPTDTANTVPPNIAGNNEYIVEVTATSGMGVRELTRVQVITVVVINQHGEVPGKPDAPTVVAVSHLTLRMTWAAPENTGPEIIDYNVQYRISGSGDNFIDTGSDGTSTTLTQLNPNATFEVQVQARNAEGTGKWSDSGVGTTNQNQAPTFSEEPSATRSFAENTAAGENIGNAVAATDLDGDELTYYLEGTDAKSFAFDETSGQLLTGSGITYNYEEQASYSVRVVVFEDLGGIASIDVTITLIDVDGEAPGKPNAPTVKMVTTTSLTVTWTAPENTGPEITDYDVQYKVVGRDFIPWPHNGTGLTTMITNLEDGEDYLVQVRATNAEGTGNWSDSGAGMTRLIADYDADDDGLIEVSSLEQLNAIRYDLDGDGQVDNSNNADAYTLAFPDAVSGMGCPESGCAGYELTRDLDFNDPDSYTSGMVNTAWITGSGWEPIGTSTDQFAAVFHGGGHTISDLFIDRYDSNPYLNRSALGLFGYSDGTIQNVGLIEANVKSRAFYVGGLVGWTTGTVSATYVTGQVENSFNSAGGLVGENAGLIRTSYSRASVVNTFLGGGLVGRNQGTLLACYSTWKR